MNVSVILIIVGVLIALGSFLFALFNIGRQAKRVFNGDVGQAVSDFGGALAHHLGSMAGMVIGGLIAFIGIALLFFGY